MEISELVLRIKGFHGLGLGPTSNLKPKTWGRGGVRDIV